MPSMGAIAKILMSMFPKPTAARVFGSFMDPTNAKLIVCYMIFRTEPIEEGTANHITFWIMEEGDDI